MNTVLYETRLASGTTLQLVRGDIAAETTDAIVNAANKYLRHGGGVAGVIAERGGPEIQRQSDAWVRTHGLVHHEAPAWTSGGDLPCRYVIHAVGPVWGAGDEASTKSFSRADASLAAAVTGSMRAAEGLGLESIALPAISTGIFGFPRERAAGVILSALQDHFAAGGSGIKIVRLVLYDRETLEAFEKVWHDHFSAKPQA